MVAQLLSRSTFAILAQVFEKFLYVLRGRGLGRGGCHAQRRPGSTYNQDPLPAQYRLNLWTANHAEYASLDFLNTPRDSSANSQGTADVA
jgi:hypothetical protein